MDASEQARAALEFALDVHPDAAITVLHVAGEPSPMMGRALRMALESDVGEAAREAAEEEVFSGARALAAEHDREIETVVAVGSPTRQILKRAEDYDAVILGSHGGNLRSTLVTGNVASKVSDRAPVSVTVVR